jgi:hypothetical protein
MMSEFDCEWAAKEKDGEPAPRNLPIENCPSRGQDLSAADGHCTELIISKPIREDRFSRAVPGTRGRYSCNRMQL